MGEQVGPREWKREEAEGASDAPAGSPAWS